MDERTIAETLLLAAERDQQANITRDGTPGGRMTLAERIYKTSLDLPEYAAREALDFIEFLAERHGLGESVVATGRPGDEVTREQALAHLATVRIDWGGKPIPDRNALYDDARE